MTAPHDPKEAGLRALACMVAECQGLASRLGKLDELVGRDAAPFLYRQLGKALGTLSAAIDAAAEREVKKDGGLLKKIRKGFLGGGKDEAVAQDEGLQGNARTIPIPELIGFLANGRKTGVLWVHAPEETFVIQICDGVLRHATSDRTPEGERLGEILVQQGTIDRSSLEQFLRTHAKGAGMLGDALHRDGLVDMEQLRAGLSAQVQSLFHRLLRTGDGVFRFQAGLELSVQHQIRLNVTQLLLESARQCDERTLRELEAAMDLEATVSDILEDEQARASEEARAATRS